MRAAPRAGECAGGQAGTWEQIAAAGLVAVDFDVPFIAGPLHRIGSVSRCSDDALKAAAEHRAVGGTSASDWGNGGRGCRRYPATTCVTPLRHVSRRFDLRGAARPDEPGWPPR